MSRAYGNMGIWDCGVWLVVCYPHYSTTHTKRVSLVAVSLTKDNNFSYYGRLMIDNHQMSLAATSYIHTGNGRVRRGRRAALRLAS